MSFTREEKRKVLEFFQDLLETFNKPTYYENLRGHVSKADSSVKDYVRKECKGENLLKYFKMRKNYFLVDFRNEVCLIKKKHDFHTGKKFCDAEKANQKEMAESYGMYNEEICTDSEYSDYSRFDSVSSLFRSTLSSVEEDESCSVDKKQLEYENIIVKYFKNLLERKKQININSLKMQSFPKKVQPYITKYLKTKTVLKFFKSNSELFHIDERDYVTLVLDNIPQQSYQDKGIPDVIEEEPVECDMVKDFFQCVEFFVNLLKRKALPLKKIRGHLSEASPSVSNYLKFNFKSFEEFCHKVDKLFIFSDNEHVSLAKDGIKLLKQAKETAQLISNSELESVSLENVIHFLFQHKRPNIRSSERHRVNNSCSGIKELKVSLAEFPNEDSFQSTKSEQTTSGNFKTSNTENVHDPKPASSKKLHCDKTFTQDIKTEPMLNKSVNEDPFQSTKSEKPTSGNFKTSNTENNHDAKPASSKKLHCDKTFTQDIKAEPMLNKSVNEDSFQSTKSEKPTSGHFKTSNTENNHDTKLAFSKKLHCDKTFTQDIKAEPMLNKSVNLHGLKDDVLNDKGGSLRQINHEGFDNSYNSNIHVFDRKESNTQRHFFQCVYTAQLLCLEVMEKEYILCLKFEYEAVKFFVEILEGTSGRINNVNFIKGNLGRASSDINLFMKQLYKGEEFTLFFKKHKEFVLDGSVIQLSPIYKDYLEDKKKKHELFITDKKVYDVHNLYNSHCDIFANVCDCLAKICFFLQNKSKTKFSRLKGIVSKFSVPQKKFINSLHGCVSDEKFEKFVHYFSIFNFSGSCVEFNPDLDVSLLVNLISQFTKDILNRCDTLKLSYFDYFFNNFLTHESNKYMLDVDVLKNTVIDLVQNYLANSAYLNYSDLPNIVDYEIICTLVLMKKDSQFLIQILEDSNLFHLKDGQVFQKDDDVEEILLDIDFIKNIVIELVQNYLTDSSCLSFSELLNIVDYQIIHTLLLMKKDSQFLVQILEDSNLFLLKDGKVFQKDNVEEEILPDENAPSETDKYTNLSYVDADVPKIHNENFQSEMPEANSFYENIKNLDTELKVVYNKNSSEDLKEASSNDLLEICNENSSEDSKDASFCDLLEICPENTNKDLREAISKDLVEELPSKKNVFKNNSQDVLASCIYADSNGINVIDKCNKQVKHDTEDTPAFLDTELNIDVLCTTESNETDIESVDNLSENINFICHSDLQFTKDKCLEINNSMSKENKVFDTDIHNSNICELGEEKHKSISDKSDKEINDNCVNEKHFTEFENKHSCSDSKYINTGFAESISPTKNIEMKDVNMSLDVVKNIEMYSISGDQMDSENDDLLNNLGINEDTLETSKFSSKIYLKEEINMEKHNEYKRTNRIEDFSNKSSDTSENYNVPIYDTESSNHSCVVTENVSKLKNNDSIDDSKIRQDINEKLEYISNNNNNNNKNLNFHSVSDIVDQSSFKFENISEVIKNEENDVSNKFRNRSNIISKQESKVKTSEDFKAIINYNLNMSDDISRNKNLEVIEESETSLSLFGIEKDHDNSFLAETSNSDTSVIVSNENFLIDEFENDTNPAYIDENVVGYKTASGIENNVAFCGKLPLSKSDFIEKVENKYSSQQNYSKQYMKPTINPDEEVCFQSEKSADATDGVSDSKYEISNSATFYAGPNGHITKNDHTRKPNMQTSSEDTQKKDSIESDSEDNGPCDDLKAMFLQPLHAKVILLTLDSCIVESVINDHKKYIFCLKSSFHCDQHTDCSECFESLAVGDEVSCYIPPTKDTYCGNMCFSFMFSKDSKAKNNESSFALLSFDKGNSRKLKSEFFSQGNSQNKSKNNLSNVISDRQQSTIGECQTVLSGDVKLCSLAVEKECQVECSTMSQHMQTVQPLIKYCQKIEKGCQIKCLTVSQDTQTVCQLSEMECQTTLSGEVKKCPRMSDKTCLTKYQTLSQNVQTEHQSIENSCQTIISGNIKNLFDTSSTECQTTWSEQNCVDRYCQTNDENYAKLSEEETDSISSAFLYSDVPLNANTIANSRCSSSVVEKSTCDMECQTMITGPIKITKLYLT